MSLGNALTFIKRAMADTSLRKRLNASKTDDEVAAVLSDEALVFSEHEFDEAYHHQLTLCQEKEDADQLNEFKLWWQLVSNSKPLCASGSKCGGCSM